MICYYCGRKISNKTRDHFVPRAVIKSIGLVEDFRDIDILPMCQACNRHKADRILFPPLQLVSWWQLDYLDKLYPLQEAFYKLATIVVKTPSTSFKSEYWEEWINWYRKCRYGLTFPSPFDKCKILTELEYVKLAEDYEKYRST